MHIAKGFPKWQDFSAVTIENSLLSGKINREVPVCLQRCEETGRIENIRRAAQNLGKGYCGRFFNDSDLYKVFLYKVLRCGSFAPPRSRTWTPCDEIIEYIAQQPDGCITADHQIAACRRKTTVHPIVYCFERHDNAKAWHLCRKILRLYAETSGAKCPCNRL